MKRLCILLISCLMVLPVYADDFLKTQSMPSLFDQAKGQQAQQDFLSADQAFQLEKINDDHNAITFQFNIAEGYYLYKDRFSFKTSQPKIEVKPVLPAGEKKNDEFFGEMQVYHNELIIKVPFTNPNNDAFDLSISYQGCAEQGLCYPLETKQFHIKTDKVTSASVVKPTLDSGFVNVLTQKLGWSVFYYLFIGLALAFTPCVFPMLPILSAIILKGQPGSIRSQLLALTYVLFMALTYAVLGVCMGLFGAELGLQAKLQSPWILVPFALFFVVFAVAMFGVFELRLPHVVTNPLNRVAHKTHGGSFVGVALLGICTSLILSPCITAPFAGILFHISATGDAVGGGISLFFLGLGMGIPLFIIAAGGGVLLPKAGAWMVVVRNLFGVLLLVVAIELLARVLPEYVTLLLWGLLAAGIAIFMGVFELATLKTKYQRLGQLVGFFLVVYAVCAWVGAWQGHTDPLRPLVGEDKLGVSVQQTIAEVSAWHIVKTSDELNQLLKQAKTEQKYAIIDWYADWCVSCKKMEREVFNASSVKRALANYELIRVDVTASTVQQQQLLDHYKLFGPPAVLFINSDGKELNELRIIGEVGREAFLAKLIQLAQ